MKNEKSLRRLQRVRSKIKSISDRPRLMVYRSNVHLWAQVVDSSGKVLASASSKSLKTGTKTEKSTALGIKLGEQLKSKKVVKVVFDRAGYRYHGRVKAFAEGARKAGLEF